jgi:hypothetical protein
LETIEDFMLHAPLKNISVQLKRSQIKEHGFSNLLPEKEKRALIRNYEKEITTTDKY